MRDILVVLSGYKLTVVEPLAPKTRDEWRRPLAARDCAEERKSDCGRTSWISMAGVCW